MNLGRCTSSILDTSVLVYRGRRGPCWPGRRPDPVWSGCWLSFYGECSGAYNLAKPLRVEHVAVEIDMESFRPSAHFLRIMRTSAKWCRFDTSYFTHNRVERGSVLFLPVQVQRTCPSPNFTFTGNNDTTYEITFFLFKNKQNPNISWLFSKHFSITMSQKQTKC